MLQKYLQESAIKWPEKIAVKFKQETITYRELDKLSNQIASAILDAGVSPGSNVGLYLPKSNNAVAAIFGILKAGSTYVPLDPESPIERIQYISANCQLAALVTDENRMPRLLKNKDLFPEKWKLFDLATTIPALSGFPENWLYSGRAEIENRPGEPADFPFFDDENNLAFILYTSGSTGQPKGVMLSHRNASVFIDWAADYVGPDENDIFASHAPFHFDLSVFDIYVSFKTGGTLCLLPAGVSYFPEAVLNFIAGNRISVWYSVPSALIQLLEQKGLVERLRTLQTIIYAGEVFPYLYLNQFRRALGHSNIYNLYGPTETNVITYYKVEINPAQPLEDNVPIGKPCPYARIFIVGEDDQPVKTGEVGELVVNGASLMAGYWGDPEKTAKSIRNLTIDGREEFFYFTGDLVYQKPDGNIYYVNRRDNMVKTRGFRVELGEIETTLYRHTAVHKAAVVAIPDEKIGHRLSAFLALNQGQVLSVDEVEKHCGRFLPTYMIPEKIIFLEQMPLTPNGKIDREKLKAIV